MHHSTGTNVFDGFDERFVRYCNNVRPKLYRKQMDCFLSASKVFSSFMSIYHIRCLYHKNNNNPSNYKTSTIGIIITSMNIQRERGI